MELVERALAWAAERHGDQRYGDQPYEVHLHAVVELVRQYDGSQAALAAAALHDVVEDSETTPEAVAAEFGAEVAALVSALTKPPRGTQDRLLRYFDGIRAAGSDAVFVKLADRIANVRASLVDGTASLRLLRKYQGEQPLFVERLRRPQEHDALWRLLDGLLRSASA